MHSQFAQTMEMKSLLREQTEIYKTSELLLHKTIKIFKWHAAYTYAWNPSLKTLKDKNITRHCNFIHLTLKLDIHIFLNHQHNIMNIHYSDKNRLQNLL